MSNLAANPLTGALRAELKSAEVPGVFLDYQAAWIRDDAQLKIAEKSRRIGLTWAEASDCVDHAARAPGQGGMNAYYIGYNMDMAIEFIEACAMWARVYNQAAGEIEEGEEIFRDERDEEQRIKTYTIKFPSGFRIVALSSRPANLRGKQGIVVIDEAAFHGQLGELIKAAIALLIWGGKVRIISTHFGDQNPFNDLIQDVRSGKRSGSVHRIEFAEAVRQGLYRRVCMRLRKAWDAKEEETWVASVYKFYGDDAREELDVIPSSGEGAYLSRAQIVATQRADIPVVRWEQTDSYAMQPRIQREAECLAWCELHLRPLLDKLPKAWKYRYGCDFARVNDLSAIWLGAELPDCSVHTPFVVELRNIPYDQQRQVLFYLVKGLPNFWGGAHDARGNGGYLAEAAAQEFGAERIVQVQASPGWYMQNMPPFKAHFEDGTFTTPMDSDVLADLRSIRKIKGVPKVPDDAHTTGQDGKKRHGDTAIAAVMLIHAVENIDAVPIEFMSAGPRLGTGDLALGHSPRAFMDTGFGSVRGGNDFAGWG